MVEFLVLVIIVSSLTSAVSGLVWWFSGWRAKTSPWVTGAGVLLATVAFGGLVAGGSYMAGKGDAEAFAREWSTRFRPGSDVECQGRDTDSNGYVTCTVSYEQDGRTEVEPIECGVNRWYHGLDVTGCNPLVYIPARGGGRR